MVLAFGFGFGFITTTTAAAEATSSCRHTPNVPVKEATQGLFEGDWAYEKEGGWVLGGWTMPRTFTVLGAWHLPSPSAFSCRSRMPVQVQMGDYARDWGSLRQLAADLAGKRLHAEVEVEMGGGGGKPHTIESAK